MLFLALNWFIDIVNNSAKARRRLLRAGVGMLQGLERDEMSTMDFAELTLSKALRCLQICSILTVIFINRQQPPVTIDKIEQTCIAEISH